MEQRLNTFISNSGYCSRREADKYIESGNVTIDGKKAALGAKVRRGQRVMVNGLLIEDTGNQKNYIAFNKPVGIVSTTDTAEKDNIVDYISFGERIFPIGRLDKDSQGLILLTDDGSIVNKILRAENDHKKEYLVTVGKEITDEFLRGMSGGVPILDRVTKKCQLEKITPFIFRITLTQGLNRQIRRMCEYFNYPVVKLERVKIMHIELGKLPLGEWRQLTDVELDKLFDSIKDSASEKADKPKTNDKAGSKPQKKASMSKEGAKFSPKSKPASGQKKSFNPPKSSKKANNSTGRPPVSKKRRK